MPKNRRLRSATVATALILILLSPRMLTASSFCPDAEETAKQACSDAADAALAAAVAAFNLAVDLANASWDNLPLEEQTNAALAAHIAFLEALEAALAATVVAIRDILAACLAAADLIC